MIKTKVLQFQNFGGKTDGAVGAGAWAMYARWVQVRRRERNGTEGTAWRGTVRGEGVGAGAWDSAGNACAAYVGEWGASLAAGELWAMCERRVQVRTGGGARRVQEERRDEGRWVLGRRAARGCIVGTGSSAPT